MEHDLHDVEREVGWPAPSISPLKASGGVVRDYVSHVGRHAVLISLEDDTVLDRLVDVAVAVILCPRHILSFLSVALARADRPDPPGDADRIGQRAPTDSAGSPSPTEERVLKYHRSHVCSFLCAPKTKIPRFELWLLWLLGKVSASHLTIQPQLKTQDFCVVLYCMTQATFLVPPRSLGRHSEVIALTIPVYPILVPLSRGSFWVA